MTAFPPCEQSTPSLALTTPYLRRDPLVDFHHWLLLCALLLGLGFNVKMLEAYLVVPTFALVYLLAVPHPWRRRVAHLALAGVLMVAVSLPWALVVDFTPANQRPYVGSSSTNSEIELAFGYNGIERLIGFARFGRSPATGSNLFSAFVQNTSFLANKNGALGPLRLLNQQLDGQASWLLPLAVLGLLITGWCLRPRAPTRDWRAWLQKRPAGHHPVGDVAAHLEDFLQHRQLLPCLLSCDACSGHLRTGGH